MSRTKFRGRPHSALLRATRVLYDTLRAYCAVNETDGQPLAPPWHKADDTMIAGLTGNLLVYLANPGAPDHLLHTLATEQLRREGWQRGPDNPSARTAPTICAFHELPTWMQDMNRLTKAVADALRASMPADEIKHAIEQTKAQANQPLPLMTH